MSIRIKIEKVNVVKIVYTEKEVNDLIKNGWEVQFIGATHKDGMGFNAKPTFILAKGE